MTKMEKCGIIKKKQRGYINMYNKDLDQEIRLRVNKTDYDFLYSLSLVRGVSLSECVRSILGEYRRDYIKNFSKNIDDIM